MKGAICHLLFIYDLLNSAINKSHIFFKKTIFTNTTSPTVELGNDTVSKDQVCVKSDKSETT